MLLTPDDLKRLLEHGRQHACHPGFDPWPVAKLWAPRTRWAWLLGALDASDRGVAIGVCDLARGMPELGPVRIMDLEAISAGPLGPVVRDGTFVPQGPLSAYLRRAQWAGGILDASV